MKFRRTIFATAATVGLMSMGLAPASAHVSVDPDVTAAGEYSVLTFSASHGCEGSPSTSFTINIPDSIAEAKPTVYPGWDVKKVEEKLDDPVTLEGGTTITKHVGQIVYTAKEPLKDGYRMAFEVQVQNPGEAGKTLHFPTLQECKKGQTDWSQIPEEGQDPHALDAPAPSYTLTNATSEGHHDQGEDTEATAAASSSEQAAQVSDNGASPVPGYLGLTAGVLGLILGGYALSRTRTGK